MRIFKNIAGFFKNIWLTRRFFLAFTVVFAVLCTSFAYPKLIVAAQILALVITSLTLADLLFLYRYSKPMSARREHQRLLSNGDDNPIHLFIQSESAYGYNIELYEELPFQLQKRDFHFGSKIKAGEELSFTYTIHPTERGAYDFGNINIFLKSRLGLVQRRQICPATKSIPVYPSIIQMKKYGLRALEKASHFYGIKKLRRIGQSYEFEQIKNYVRGDDYRKINWKATGKHHSLMINQYVEERSQMVYCFLDQSRNMKMPFYGLSLFDYAVNASLVLSNVSLQKQDKAGLISFSNSVDTIVPAGNKSGQLRRVLEALYKERGKFVESNYELLYTYVRRIITNRSLIFLFTNFESMYNLKRNINVLRKLNLQHLLVVVFFENTEITSYLEGRSENMQDIYEHTIAEKFMYEKERIVQELRKYGIQTIYTKPEDLTVNSINRYLEIKAKGLI